MTAYETRAATEDERDRLALLHRYEVVDSSGRRVIPHTMSIVAAEAYAVQHWSWTYRPADKQGDVEPFDVEADWAERS